MPQTDTILDTESALAAEELADAGASPEFLRVYLNDREENRVRDETNRKVNFGVSPEEVAATAGGFFGHLWDGDLYAAMCRSDFSNGRLLADTFEPEAFVAAGLDNGLDAARVVRRVEDFHDR